MTAPECPRCLAWLEDDMGPAADPDDDGNVVMEHLLVCRVCGWAEPVRPVALPEEEWRARVNAWIATHGLGRGERERALAEIGYETGWRWWPC